MKVYVESKDQLIEKRADSRGRVTLGSEYANKEVQLALLAVEGEEYRWSVVVVAFSCLVQRSGWLMEQVAQGGLSFWRILRGSRVGLLSASKVEQLYQWLLYTELFEEVKNGTLVRLD
jgi:hypothetical protein